MKSSRTISRLTTFLERFDCIHEAKISPNILRFLSLIFGAFLLGLYFTIPLRTYGFALDDSWLLTLFSAKASNAQFGKDVIFTYGPLLGLSRIPYLGDYPAWAVFWQTLTQTILAFFIISWALRLRKKQALLFFGALILLPAQPEIFVPLSFVCFALECLDRFAKGSRNTNTFVLCGIALLATAGLVKFTFLIAGTIIALSLIFGALVAKRYRLALLAPLFGTSIIGLLWVGTGQKLSSFLPWLKGSWEISKGYTAMSVNLVDPIVMSIGGWLALGTIILLIALGASSLPSTLLHLLKKGNSDSLQRALILPGAFLVCMIMFLEWRHGFIRADRGHTSIWFTFVALAIILSSTLFRHSGKLFGSTYCIVLTIVLFGSSAGLYLSPDKYTPNPIGRIGSAAISKLSLFHPESARTQSLETNHANHSAQSELTHLKNLVGDSPIDIFGINQAAAYYAGLNHTPRPIFQSYSVYTPYLAEKNIEFFESEKAPPFCLVNLFSIDGRYPASEDGRTLRFLSNHYSVSNRGAENILLKRKPNDQLKQNSDVSTTLDGVMGEPLSLPPYTLGDQVWVEFHLNHTFAGSFHKSLAQQQELSILFISSDGATRHHRLVPELAEIGFLARPYIATENDLVVAVAKEKADFIPASIVVRPSGNQGKNPLTTWKPNFQVAVSHQVEIK